LGRGFRWTKKKKVGMSGIQGKTPAKTSEEKREK